MGSGDSRRRGTGATRREGRRNGEVAEGGVKSRGLKVPPHPPPTPPSEWRSSLFVGDGHDQVQEQLDVSGEVREDGHEGRGRVWP